MKWLTVLASLFLVGCAATSTAEPTVQPTAEPTAEPTAVPTAEPAAIPTESAPVGGTVRLLDPDGKPIEMYGAANPNAAVIATFPVDTECEVLSGPRTVADVAFWELACPVGTEPGMTADTTYMKGWFDVTKLEVID